MLLYILVFSLIIILCFVVYEDFKYRAITWYLFVFIFILSYCISFFYGDIKWFGFIYNILVLFIQLIIIWIYVSIKHRKIVAILDEFIGLGDIAFFISISPLFTLFNYIVFIILGLLATLVLFTIFNILKFINNKLVPLAGFFAFFLILIAVLDLFFNYNTFIKGKMCNNILLYFYNF